MSKTCLRHTIELDTDLILIMTQHKIDRPCVEQFHQQSRPHKIVPNPPPRFNDFIPIPIPIWNLNPIPIFPMSNSQFPPIPIPIRQLNRDMGIYEDLFMWAACLCWSQPTVLDKLKKASKLTIKWIDSLRKNWMSTRKNDNRVVLLYTIIASEILHRTMHTPTPTS